VVRELIPSLHSQRYRSSGMLIHRQNSDAPHDEQPSGRREAQNHEIIQQN
jgi:hypothetical protein